jgi:PST family polysaccharide transporter
MTESQQSYRNILKATSLFGGVQFIITLFSIVRTKFIALWIGPEGMGIIGLLNTGLNLMGSLTDFGLGTSAVRDLAVSNGASDDKTIGVIRRLVWLTGLLGTVSIIILSPLLSKLAFGNNHFIYAFIWISLALLFRQLTTGNLVILQGLRKLKLLAKVNVWGSLAGLVFILPLYYFWRIEAIVPAIVLATVFSYIISRYYAKNLTNVPDIPIRQAITEGKKMLGLGFLIGMGGLLNVLVAYLINLYISFKGNVDQVGLYQAGFVVINSYVGLIFNAMGTDYFPRLSAVCHDRVKTQKTLSEQALMGILIITPIIVLFLAASPIIIRLLYAASFMPVVTYVKWAIMGMLFKAASWSMGYVIIARADSKVYSKTMIIFNVLLLLLSVFGYTIDGLRGLGIAFLIYYIVHFLTIGILCHIRYGYRFSEGFYPIFSISIGFCLLSLIATSIEYDFWRYGVSGLVLLISTGFTIYQLDIKINFKAFIFEKLNKNKSDEPVP